MLQSFAAKVPPGVAGHPVCLDISTEIHLKLFGIVGIVLKHNPRYFPILSLPDRPFVKCLDARCVSQLVEYMLLSLQTPSFNAAHSRYNALVMSKVGSSDAL